MIETLELTLFDDDVVKLAFRFLHNVLFLALVVRFAWHPYGRDREFAFAAMMLNITVFFICFTMKKLELSIGMALGLFAIFGVLRYRTESISTKDLTYLFVVVGLAVVNSLTNKKTSYVELILVNATIFGAAWVGERLISRLRGGLPPGVPEAPVKLRKQTIEYDRLELLAPGRRDELLADVRQRSFLAIEQLRVESVDLPKGRATLAVWVDERQA